MAKKEVTIIKPVAFGSITVIPVVKVTVDGWNGKSGSVLSGSIQPESIVIATPLTQKAFRITGEEVTLDRIAEEFSDIIPFLEKL